MADQSTTPHSLPERIGPYKILEEIGGGGFGFVYKARAEGDINVNDTPLVQHNDLVAIKVLERLSGDARDRFSLEIEISRHLDHPHIIKVRDQGWYEGRPFMVMDYIEGGSLSKQMKQNRLDRAETVRIIKCIAEALGHAHSLDNKEQIIHRDIKPDNILLDKRRDSTKPLPLLVDFGIAKIKGSNTIKSISETGMIIGTPPYMAPEQFDGSEPTPATDFYALGVLFFEMLAGEHPYQLAIDDNKNRPDTWWLELHDNYSPSILSKLVSPASPYFDTFFQKALNKDSINRYKSADEFIRDLEKVNTKAEVAENQALDLYKMAESIWQHSKGEPNEAEKTLSLSYLNQALELWPGHLASITLKSKIADDLDIAKQACEQMSLNPSSTECVNYVELLAKRAEKYWTTAQPLKAVEYYHEIYRVLGDTQPNLDQVQKIWKVAHSRLIDYHYSEGTRAKKIALEDLDEAIQVLEDSCKWLNRLHAEPEERELFNDLKTLKIRKIENQIVTLQHGRDEIRTILEKDVQHEQKFIESYKSQAAHYQELLNIEVRGAWEGNLRETWHELVQQYRLLAQRAEDYKDFVTALEYLQDIVKIKQDVRIKIVPEIDLEAKINKLQEQAKLEGKYREINRLIEEKKYLKALTSLGETFGFADVYQFEDVAKLFWIATYAVVNNNQLPPELTSIEELEAKLTATRQEKETLKKELTEKIAQTRADLDAAQLSLKQKQDEIVKFESDLNTKAQTLQTQLTQAKQRERELTNKITQNDDQLKEMRLSLEDAQQTRARLEGDLQAKSQILETHNKKIKEGDQVVRWGTLLGAIAVVIIVLLFRDNRVMTLFAPGAAFVIFGFYVWFQYFRRG